MAMLWALAVVLLLESLAAITLVATAARVRVVADRRWAIEAGLALESAMAHARVAHDSALAALPPGAAITLAPPLVPGWRVTVHASREPATSVARLDVAVERRTSTGGLFAARRGTLLLVVGSADTAIVLDSRPRS